MEPYGQVCSAELSSNSALLSVDGAPPISPTACSVNVVSSPLFHCQPPFIKPKPMPTNSAFESQRERETAFFKAADEGDVLAMGAYSVEYIKETCNLNNEWAWMMAAARGHIPLLKSLFERKIDLSIPDKFGNTALHCAARNNHVNVIQFLYDIQATMHAKNSIGYTPLCEAISGGAIEAVEFFFRHGENLNPDSWTVKPAFIAIHAGNITIVRMLCAKKVDMAVKSEGGQTLAHCAAFAMNLEIIQFLNSIGLMFDSQDNDGNTPAHYLVQQRPQEDFMAAVEFIFRLGCDLSVRNKFGYSVEDLIEDTVKRDSYRQMIEQVNSERTLNLETIFKEAVGGQLPSKVSDTIASYLYLPLRNVEACPTISEHEDKEDATCTTCRQGCAIS